MMAVFITTVLFLLGIVAGANNNVLGISLPICAILVFFGYRALQTLEGIERKLDEQVDATYDQIRQDAKRDP